MAKYNFTLAPALREYIEWQIEYYPDNKRQLMMTKASMIPSATPKYGPQTGGFNPEQRPTEDIVVRRNPDYIMEQERIISAIESVYTKLTDSDKEIIRLKYWSGELTPDGIALKLNMDRATMYRHLNAIITEVARRLGLVDI